MRLLLLLAVGCLLGLTTWGQAKPYPKIDTSRQSREYWDAWYKDLEGASVTLNRDTLRVGDEVRRIASDLNYRNLIYPAQYTWPQTITFIENMELKKAFWYLINIFATQKNHQTLVMQTVVAYDQIMDMEKILTSTFYSYAPFEPAVCQFKGGKPVISRPDLLEKKMMVVKEMVRLVGAYREKNKGVKPLVPLVKTGAQPQKHN